MYFFNCQQAICESNDSKYIVKTTKYFALQQGQIKAITWPILRVLICSFIYTTNR